MSPQPVENLREAVATRLADDSAAYATKSRTRGDRLERFENRRMRSRNTDIGGDQRVENYDIEIDREIREQREGTHGQPLSNSLSMIPPKISNPIGSKVPTDFSIKAGRKRKAAENVAPGLKKRRTGKASNNNEDMPPTPYGCEWVRSDQGWNLWRCWSEKDESTKERVKKNRLAGHISNEAWQTMKDYDYETFISVIGQRLRRYGKR